LKAGKGREEAGKREGETRGPGEDEKMGPIAELAESLNVNLMCYFRLFLGNQSISVCVFFVSSALEFDILLTI